MKLAASLASIALSMAIMGMNPSSSAQDMPPVLMCSGCTASGASNSYASGSAGTVAIFVTASSGVCIPGATNCEAVPCSVTVDRTWSGVTQGTSVAHCFVQDKIRYCESPAPIVDGTGAGSSNRSGTIACGKSTYFTVSAGSGTNQVIAGASASCTNCP